jgi:O-antigen ligase
MDPDMPQGMIFVKEAHTIQAKILAEQGLIGITVAFWLFFTILFHGIRSIKPIKDDFLKNTQIGLTALFIGFIVNFTFASDPFNNMFWITIGFLYAVPLVDNMHVPETGDSLIPVS